MSAELNDYLKDLPVFEYRLTDGSWIVAWELNATTTYHQIAYPMEVFFADDKSSINLDEWIPFSSDNKFYLNCSNIVAFTSANIELTKFYHKHLISLCLVSDLNSISNGSAQSLTDFLHFLDPTKFD